MVMNDIFVKQKDSMSKSSSNKLRLLLIEDDPISMLISTEMLMHDYKLFHATSGETGLELASKIKFDLIIIDLHLNDEEMDGIKVMHIIKENIENSTTKLMAISSFCQPDDRKKLLEEGFDMFFEKPLEKDEILKAINIINKDN